MKARHDIGRLRSDPTDAYAAFDFFVTVRHVPDWLYPNQPTKRDRLFSKHVELRICRHLADGAKHFEATHPRHKQVASTWKSSGAWGNAWAKGVWKPGVWGDGLFISLDPSDSDTKSIGSRISALQLAERALAIVEKAVI
ncbi:MAG: hypothetical protein HYX43_00225 [Burkholderiales bacterium]|nr:hypothetical protein [Burkholderiales bacterium]